MAADDQTPIGADAPNGGQATDAPESSRELKRRVRNRRFGLALGVFAAVAVSALLVSSVLPPASGPGESAGVPGADSATPTEATTSTAAPAPTPIDGLETFANEPSHVTTAVAYPQTPPAGGPHSPVWLDCGVYDRAVPNENAVHSLEHGAVWATYDPTLPAAEVAALVAALPAEHVVVSPYPGLDSPIVLTAWNVQLRPASAGDPRIPAFAAAYRNGPTAPEPGESCSGALEAPGKVG